MVSRGNFVLLLLSVLSLLVESLPINPNSPKLDAGASSETGFKGKKWAVLIAGSNTYINYRHQADVCHAYQLLKKGGLSDENIIVFMYDDIAFSPENPKPGVIINHPDGDDLYEGVPKDYTGKDVNVNNFLNVILGNKSAVTGGSGKVVDSGPEDHIFIYYADHGSPGLLVMPSGDDLYAKDFVNALKKKHEAPAYKNMVIYIEACESGSIFEGLLPKNLSIYAITAANASESSWAAYCPGEFPSPSMAYDTCLGDLFSVSWMEDSEKHDTSKETLEKQYGAVRRRTAVDDLDSYHTSHVMQYGSKELGKEFLLGFIGTNDGNDNYTAFNNFASPRHVDQRDADLLPFWLKFRKAPKASQARDEARKTLAEKISGRKHIDNSINHAATSLFGEENGSQMLKSTRPAGEPLVDDWDCFKSLVKSLKEYCGLIWWNYAMKHTRVLANMCNAGVNVEQAKQVIKEACSSTYDSIMSSVLNELGD